MIDDLDAVEIAGAIFAGPLGLLVAKIWTTAQREARAVAARKEWRRALVDLGGEA